MKEIDRHARDLEKQQRALEKHSRDLASGTSIDSLKARLTQPMSRVDEIVTEQEFAAAEADVPEMIAAKEIAGGIESIEDVDAPWTPIEETDPWAVPLETDEPVAGIAYDAAALPEPDKKGRPRWMVSAAVAGMVVLLLGGAYGISHRTRGSAKPTVVAAGSSAQSLRTPDTAAMPSVAVTDSAAGVIAAPALADSAVFTALRDSIAQADAEKRAARRAKIAAEAAAAQALTITDSTGQKWSTVPPQPLDSVARAAMKKDSTVKKDTTVKVKPDTGRVRLAGGRV